MSNLINTLNNINDNTSFRTKHININNVLASLEELKQLLNLTQDSDMNELYNNNEFVIYKDNKYDFNYCIFLYIENYAHLTTDKKERAEIKKICLKLKDKYHKYFYKYNREHKEPVDEPTEI
jgi:hypothetical protein